MADAGRDVKINIDIEGDVAKAKAIESVLGEIKDTVKEQSDAQKKMNEEASAGAQVLDTLGSRTGAARDVIEGLDQASKGGINSVFGLARAAKNFIEVISLTNPIARVISLIAALSGGVYVLIKRFGDVKRPIEDAGDAASSAASQFEKLEQLNLENTKKAIDDVLGRLKNSSDEAEKLRDRLASLEDAKLAQELAKIDLAVASGELSKEDASFLKASQIADAESRKSSTERSVLEAEQGQIRSSVATAQTELARAQAKFEERRLKLDKAVAAGGSEVSSSDARAELEKERESLARYDLEVANRGQGITAERLGPRADRVSGVESAQRQLDLSLAAETARVQMDDARRSRELAQARLNAANSQAGLRMPEIENRLQILDIQQSTSSTRFAAAGAERSGFFAGRFADDQAGNTAARQKGRELISRAGEIARDTTNTDDEVSALLDDLFTTLQGIGRRFAGSDAKLAALRKELDTLNSQNKYGGTR